MKHLFSGECKEGYEKKPFDSGGFECKPINLCHRNNETLCNANSSCQYIGPGQYQCKCNQGFSGDGFKCWRKLCYNPNCSNTRVWQTLFCSSLANCDDGCLHEGLCIAPGKCPMFKWIQRRQVWIWYWWMQAWTRGTYVRSGLWMSKQIWMVKILGPWIYDC